MKQCAAGRRLCTFKFEDIDQAPNGKPIVKLNFSKTDQYGAGKVLPISQELLSLLNKWKGIVGNQKLYPKILKPSWSYRKQP